MQPTQPVHQAQESSGAVRWSLLAAALFLTAGCATKKSWQAEGVSEIRVFTANTEPKGSREEVEVMQEVLESMGRAQPSSPVSGISRPWTYKIDVVGTTAESGRWLYAPKTGEFMRLSLANPVIYRLSKVDQARLEELLKIPSAAPVPAS